MLVGGGRCSGLSFITHRGVMEVFPCDKANPNLSTLASLGMPKQIIPGRC